MAPRVRRCVICHRPLAAAEDRWFPFCSERCKWVDLGRWLGEAYRIPGAAAAEAQPTGGEGEGESAAGGADG